MNPFELSIIALGLTWFWGTWAGAALKAYKKGKKEGKTNTIGAALVWFFGIIAGIYSWSYFVIANVIFWGRLFQ
jgi:hypothetical protein